MLKQLHIVPDISVSFGGTGLAAIRYAEAIAKAGSHVTLFVGSPKSEHSFETTFDSSSLQIINGPAGSQLFGSLITQYKAIDSLVSKNSFDLVHLHGVWLPLFVVATIIALRRQVPLVVSPHGCFEPWCLNHKRMKKFLAIKTYQRFINRAASMFFATASQELESLRRLGICQPIAMIPIGVDAAEPLKHVPHNEKRSMLFLSRINPKKGLLDLVEAWVRVRSPNWRIVIAGSDEEGHRSKVENLIRHHGLEQDFEFVGLVSGERKRACFANAELFVLPTHSENFGICIVEALSNQLPVITTTGAPWRDLEDYGCGWWVNPGVEGIAAALQSAMGLSREQLEDMGKRGRELVTKKYSWEKIGKDALLAYEWIIGRSNSKPGFVNIAKG